jgi:ribonuclease E
LHILRITQEEAMKDNSAIIQVQLPVEAATFLLNEKRADIHKIEQRMGVEVILIPNIHMETPNYNIVRIKHDDVNEETSQASYKMVEMPAETAYVRSLNEEAAPKAPEALVKGITPATAAPNVAERVIEEKVAAPIAKLGIFGRIKQIFVGKPVVVEERSEDKTARETRDNVHNNSDRNRNNNRDRNRNRDRNANSRDRNNVAERGDKPQQAPRTQQVANANQQPRPERVPRPERPQTDRPAANKAVENVEITETPAVTSAAVGVDANTPRPERTGRSRRGGRNRNKNRDRDQNRDPNAAAPAFVPNEPVATSAPSTAPTLAAEPVALNTSKAEPKAQKTAKPKATPKPIVVDSNIEIVATKVMPKAEPVPKAEKAVKAKAVKKPAAKPAKAKAVAAPAGEMQMVETKAVNSSAAAKAAPVAAEAAKPKVPRKAPNWKKDAAAKSDDAPLVIVQTQK